MASILSIGEIRGLNENGNVVTVPSGHKLTADAGGIVAPGQVLQVINGTYGVQESTTSTSFVPTGFSLSITPSSASSKILVTGSMNGYQTASAYIHFTIYRNDSINLGHSSYGFGELYGNTGDRFGQVSFTYLDSPNTTSLVTYKVYRRVSSATGYFNLNTGELSTLTLMEIAQ